ncbi:hypothetical protein [Pedobacter steynii]
MLSLPPLNTTTRVFTGAASAAATTLAVLCSLGFSIVLAVIEFLEHPIAREMMTMRQQDTITRYLPSFF